jgi:L-serine dehydratase
LDLSVRDIFKIGIGPSSSHTMGPMKAARDFALEISQDATVGRIAEVRAELFGSLALTGRGHGTDRAILLGLSGEIAEQIQTDTIDQKITTIRSTKRLQLLGRYEIPFEDSTSLLFRERDVLPAHPNGMRFSAYGSDGTVLARENYYSIGGGFIQKGDAASEGHAHGSEPPPKYSFASAEELLAVCETKGLAIWQIVLENEREKSGEEAVQHYLARVWNVMQECIERGLRTEGILPGGLNVRRRASRLARRLEKEREPDSLAAMDWVNAYAMAVNEENAAGGRVVTAPTNGAAGIIPAVARYYQTFVADSSWDGLLRYFLTAAAIGMLYKKNASISGAEVGCQGEVGVACSMAAGGLTAAMNGSNHQVEYAAEIGMEHNLGMTCDPIGGLVQIPCIERNAMGSVKAINAYRMAIRESGQHKVSLDQVIATMYRTGLDMQSKYKETSLGGLALNVIEC